MAVIKTALEIALEKTNQVKSDKSGISQFEARQRGKKLANAFLAEEQTGDDFLNDELKKALNNGESCLQASLKQGIFDVFAAQITLPVKKEDEKRLEKLGKGLSVIIKSNQFIEMYKQLLQIFSQYLSEMADYEKMIRQQYAPKLRMKEEELSRRLGREIRIDPFQDPEFVGFYNQQINALKANYEPVVEKAKEEVRRMFETK